MTNLISAFLAEATTRCGVVFRLLATACGSFNWGSKMSSAVGGFLACMIAISSGTTVWAANATAPVIVSGALTGSAYMQTLVSTGTAPIAWSVSAGALPPGISFGAATGLISGTPTTAGTFTFTVTATNAAGSNSMQLSLIVSAPPIPPTITTTSPMPASKTGVFYSQTLSASGTTPMTWAVTSGSLPAGLSLNTSTGVLSGTPTAMGVATFTVTATNVGGSGSQPLSLTVNAPPSVVTTSPLTAALTGTAYSQTLNATGTAPITWAVTSGALPAGLSLNGSTGAITGTPTVMGSGIFAATATNAAGSNSQQFTVTINSAPAITSASPLPAVQTRVAHLQTLSASGSTPITWSVASGTLPAGLGLNSSTGVISGTASATGTSTVTITATNAFGSNSKQLTLPVGAAPSITTTSPLAAALTGSSYSRTLSASGSAPMTWSVTNGTLPAGLALNTSTAVISGIPTTTGTASVTITATNAFGSSSAQLSLTVNAAPTITTTSPVAAARTGVAYSQTMTASGNTPITWTVTNGSLPTGLNLNAATGLISGTPVAMGVSVFSLSATNAYGSDSAPLSVTVNAAPSITTASLPNAQTGAAYSQPLTASGSVPITWSVSGSLPAGLTLNPTTGVLSGTPSVAGTKALIITASNIAGSVSAQLTLQIAPGAPPTITTASPLRVGVTGTAYSIGLSASGSAPIAWAVTGGSLPAGLSLNAATGTISGTPTTFGASSITVSATNSLGSSSVQLSLTLSAPPSFVGTSPLPAAHVGSSYSQALGVLGSTPFTFTVTNGVLPPGLTFNPYIGLISGTPTTVGVANFTVTVTNSFGASSSQFSLPVGTPATSESAIPLDSIADSLGINIHLSNGGTLYYTDFPLVLSSLQRLGVRHVRDGLIDWGAGSSFYYTNHQALASAGIHCDFITSLGQSPQLIQTYPSRVGDMEAIEAPNEFDSSGSPNWATALNAYLPIIAASVPAGVSVFGPSLVDVNWYQGSNSYNQIGNLADTFQYANLHNYYGGRNPGTVGWTPQGYGSINWNLSNVSSAWPGKPVVTTETGYLDDVGNAQSVPDSVSAAYFPRVLLEQIRHGISRTYVYTLIDDPFGTSFGLMRADGTLKPGFGALQNLTALTSDPGPIFSPSALAYSLSGKTTNIDHLLAQDRKGAFYLFLWVEQPRFDVNAQVAVAVPAQQIFLQLPQSATVSFMRQWQVDGTTLSLSGPTSGTIPLSVDDRLLVVKIAQ